MTSDEEVGVADGFKQLTIAFQLFRAHQLSRTLVGQLLEPVGVRGDDYAVLSFLYANGEASPSEMARGLDLPPTTVSGYAARFLERGLVRREPNPFDGRSYLLALTPAGRAEVERCMPAFSRGVRRLNAHLGEGGVAEVFAALDRLQSALRATLEELEDGPVRGGAEDTER